MASGCPPESEKGKFEREQKEKALLESIKDVKHIHLIYDLTVLSEWQRLRIAEFIKSGAPITDYDFEPVAFPREKKFIIDN